MSNFKVGDFVKHKKAKDIIFQIVQILEPVDNNDHSRMINCIQVTNIKSYLDTDLRRYELTDKDKDRIVDHDL